MTAPIFITADAVADLLELPSVQAFLQRRTRLQDEHDFPHPLPWCHSPLKWRRDRVLAWRDNQGLPQPRRLPEGDPKIVPLALMREAARP